MSFSRDNFSRRYPKEESFVTPNKGENRYSINFGRRNELSSFRNVNLLRVSHMMHDNNIDFSASRRKSMRIFSQRRSKADSKSDLSHPRHKDDKGHGRVGSFFSPIHGQGYKFTEQPRRLDEGSMPFNMTSKNRDDREEYLSDRLSNRNDQHYAPDNVVQEAEEADEEEKNQNESYNHKRDESESGSRLKDAGKEDPRKNPANNIKIDKDW